MIFDLAPHFAPMHGCERRREEPPSAEQGHAEELYRKRKRVRDVQKTPAEAATDAEGWTNMPPKEKKNGSRIRSIGIT